MGKVVGLGEVRRFLRERINFLENGLEKGSGEIRRCSRLER